MTVGPIVLFTSMCPWVSWYALYCLSDTSSTTASWTRLAVSTLRKS